MKKETYMYNSLIELIKETMKRKKITASQLAEQCNLSRQTIYNILNIDHMSNMDVIIKVLAALDITKFELKIR